MKSVGIAELKATLSAHLNSVKAGQELIVSERGRPVACIIPFKDNHAPERLQALVRQGVLRAPVRKKAGASPKKIADPKGMLLRALLAERDEGR